ncbi:hypothetical protein KM043_001194 [Ampulex compressa]|nr:hypothetical protein KM043_001194 [Ampulex compressa]
MGDDDLPIHLEQLFILMICPFIFNNSPLILKYKPTPYSPGNKLQETKPTKESTKSALNATRYLNKTHPTEHRILLNLSNHSHPKSKNQNNEAENSEIVLPIKLDRCFTAR